MTEQDNKKLVRIQVDEAWNKGNLAALDEVMADDVVFHDAPPDTKPGLAGFKQLISGHRAAVSDLHVEIDDMVAEGDKVAVRWTWTGTQTGEFMGIQPTGKKVTLRGMSIHRIADGRIVENWHSMDMLGMMRQLGVSAPPESE